MENMDFLKRVMDEGFIPHNVIPFNGLTTEIIYNMITEHEGTGAFAIINLGSNEYRLFYKEIAH